MSYFHLFTIFCLFIFVRADDDGLICAISNTPPVEIKYSFYTCREFKKTSCCRSGHDVDVQNDFETLVDVGDNCPYSKRAASETLRHWLCLGCDPDQPKYVVNQTTLLVCSAFAEELWEGDGSKYDGCGLRITNRNCGSGFDECGDDVVVPSYLWKSAQEFVNGIPPRGFFEGWTFKVVTPSELASYGPDQVCFGDASVKTFSFFAITFLLLFTLY